MQGLGRKGQSEKGVDERKQLYGRWFSTSIPRKGEYGQNRRFKEETEKSTDKTRDFRTPRSTNPTPTHLLLYNTGLPPVAATSLLSISLLWHAFAFCWPHIFLFSEPAHCCAVVLSGPLISKSGIPWICWSPPSDDVAMHGWGNWRICPPSSFHSTMLFSYLILCARFLSRLFSLYVFYCRNPLQTH